MNATSSTRPPREDVVARVIQGGAVAVVRLNSSVHVLAVSHALNNGGVRAIELTMTTPGALDAIPMILDAFGDQVLVGVGSVMRAAEARSAISAGAHFLVSPAFDRKVLRTAHDNDVAMMPGAFTPTEMLCAHNAGADIVKLFPADALGPAFIRAVQGPMPFLRIMPTGGVSTTNVATWLGAGAVAVGLGGALVDPALVAAGDFKTIEDRARTVSNGVAAFYAERGTA